jgi:UDP-glucose 4-epimerase
MAGRPLVIFGDGTQTRDFSYVSDTARGIIAAGCCDAAVGETLNLASGKEIPVRELAGEIASVVGRPEAEIVHDEPRPGDVLRLCGDTAKARALLGFEPKVSLREGLQALYEWYRMSGQTPEALLEQERLYNWRDEASHTDG